MSREIERREIHKGLPGRSKEHGLSTEFYRRQAEAAKMAQQQRDRQQGGDKKNEVIPTRGSGNNDNRQTDYGDTQPKQTLSLEEYYSPAAQESLKQLGRFAQQVAFDQQRQAAWAEGQVARAQTLDRQLAEMQTASNPSEISKSAPQETVINSNGKRERKALGDITPSDENIRAAKRTKIDNSQIDENIANPNTEAEKKALADKQLLREMVLPEIDREKLKKQVKAELEQDRQKQQKQDQQAWAELRWRQGATPSTLDTTQQLDKKHPDSDSDSNSDSQTQRQRQQLEAQLRNARQNELADTEQDLQNRINELPQTTTKGRRNDASKSHS